MAPALLALLIAAPTTDEIGTAWQRLMAQRPRVAVPAWTPDKDTLQELAAGVVVKTQLPAVGEATDHIISAVVVDQPIDVVWIAVLDGGHGAPQQEKMKDLVEHVFQSKNPGARLLYQRLDLPAPVSDRHWIIDVHNNPTLYESTTGDVWERTWQLDPRGDAALADLPPNLREDLDEAVWTPVNDGGWCLTKIGYATLVVYHLRTDVGGYLPASLVTAFAKSKLDGFLGQVVRRADRVPSHYVATHPPLLRPDGHNVEPYGSGKGSTVQGGL